MGHTSWKRALVLGASFALLTYTLLPPAFASSTHAGPRHTAVTNPGLCGAAVVTLLPAATPTPTLTATPTPTPTPKPHRKHTPTPTDTPVPTDTPPPADTPLPADTPTDTPVPTDTPTVTPTETPIEVILVTSTPTPILSDTPTPTDTPTVTDTPTETPTDTPTPTPTLAPLIIFPFFTDTPGPFTAGVRSAQAARSVLPITRWAADPLTIRSAAPSHPKLPAHPNIACVWTSGDSTGHPLTSFAHGKPVYLLAAWQIGSRRDLSHDAIIIRWDVFHVYQRDVSLEPAARYRYFEQWAGVPVISKPGTFRLTFTPVLVNAPKGWYSLEARAFLYGPHCSRMGCAGQARQTRFYMH